LPNRKTALRSLQVGLQSDTASNVGLKPDLHLLGVPGAGLWVGIQSDAASNVGQTPKPDPHLLGVPGAEL
jgi:hypothetical protein